MQTKLGHTGGRTSRTMVARRVAMVAVASLALAACGSSKGADIGAAKSDNTDLSSVTPAQLQATVTKAFQADIKVEDLPAEAQDAFKRASLKLTSAQLDKAFECWKATSCKVGNGSVTLGIADAFGDNQWRKFSKMELILQALTYPKIGKIISTNASGDLAKFQSNVRSLGAQGAKAIVTYDDFGAAAIPAFKAVEAQGAKVSSYVGAVPGAGVDAVTSQVRADACAVGKDMANAVTKELKSSGQIALLNGTPGNPMGVQWNKCLKDALASDSTAPKVGTSLDTSWTPAGTFKAASGLVSSGQDYSAVLADYADPLPQVVEAYEKAGKATPNLVTWTSNNGLFKAWEKRQGTDKAFDLYFTNGLNWQARLSVTAVMDALDGKKVPAALVMPQPFVKAVKGVYQSDRPDDYPGPSVLVPDALVERMLQ